jgi:hypothetical protein
MITCRLLLALLPVGPFQRLSLVATEQWYHYLRTPITTGCVVYAAWRSTIGDHNSKRYDIKKVQWVGLLGVTHTENI